MSIPCRRYAFVQGKFWLFCPRCKQRAHLVKAATARKNSICDQIGLGFPHLVECFSSRFTAPFISFCESYANPFKVKRLGKEELFQRLIRLGFRGDVRSLTERIYQKAKGGLSSLWQ